jgi:two-component system, LytTR family, response regulator
MKLAIIDDDKKIRDLYKNVVASHFTELNEICEASSMAEGVELIKTCNPDIVILDIDLGDGTGFDVLQSVKPYNFSLIFSTAFNDYAIKAIKFSALDYILKPVDENEFCVAIEKAITLREKSNLERQLKNFFEHYDKTAQPKKLILKTAGEFNIVEITDIVYCQSDNSYTSFFFANGEEIVVSKGMKEYEDILTDFNFFRPHTSYLVNLNYVKKLDKSDGGFLILKTGKEIPVSYRKKARLIQILENL